MNQSDSLSPAAVRQLDHLCDRFEAAWKGGGRPSLEDFLRQPEEPLRPALLRELLWLEQDYRRRRGEEPTPAEYAARFPGYVEVIEASFRERPAPGGRTLPLPAGNTPAPGPASDNPAASGTASAPLQGGQGADRYELGAEVGQGGIGVVYRARDRRLGRDLAVKVLREALAGSPEVRDRFAAEAQVGSQLQHPGIVPVYDLDRLDGQRPFFTMKLVEGRTLASLLEARGDPSEGREGLLGVFAQVCQAMAYAHQRGVVHRDLKPANVMVGSFGEVQVMDWGFAKVLSAEAKPEVEEPAGGDRAAVFTCQQEQGWASQDGSVMGTPRYMPPEQAQGRVGEIDKRTDVFGLGAMLCEILTGQPPYDGGTDKEVYEKAVRGDLADALARLDGCGADAALRDLARRCLPADPASRPSDAGAVAEAIAGYLASLQERLGQAQLEKATAQTREQEARATARAQRKARRWTLAAAALLAGLGLALTGLLVSDYRYRSELEAAYGEVKQERNAAFESGERAKEEGNAARRSNYNSQLLLAGNLWQFDPRAALDLLEDEKNCPEDLRDFTWGYYHRLCKRDVFTLTYPADTARRCPTVSASALSPDGAMLALVFWVNDPKSAKLIRPEVVLLDVARNRLVRSLKVRQAAVFALAFSPDGKRLATCGSDPPIQFWDTATLRPAGVLRGRQQTVQSATFSRDGNYLASYSTDRTIKLWQPLTRKELPSLMAGGIQEVAFSEESPSQGGGHVQEMVFSPDSKTLAIRFEGNRVILRDVATGRKLATFRETQNCHSMGYSPDGQIFATGGSNRVTLWDPVSKKVHAIFPSDGGRVSALAFSPDGKTLATGQAVVLLWDLATGQERTRLAGHQGRISGLAFSHDGRGLVSLANPSLRLVRGFAIWAPAQDNERTEVKVWDLTISPASITLQKQGPAQGVTFLPDGTPLAVIGARVWDLAKGREHVALEVHGPRVLSVPAFHKPGVVILPQKRMKGPTFSDLHGQTPLAFSPDGKVLVAASSRAPDEVYFWDVATGRLRTTIESAPPRVITGHRKMTGLAFAPDGKALAVAFSDRERQFVRVLDVAAGRQLWVLQRKANVLRYTAVVAFSPDSRTLAVSNGYEIGLFDTANGKERHRFQSTYPGVRCLVFSRDGRTLAVSGDKGWIELWDVPRWELRLVFPHARWGFKGVSSLAISPDGKTLASAGLNEAVKLWDTVSGQLRATLRRHDARIVGLEFSPDGRTLVSRSDDGVQLWRTTPWKKRHRKGPPVGTER
jgi:WD40 repeat protein